MDEPTVEVTAIGWAWAAPDQVVVRLAIEARAAAVGEALRSASDGVTRLLDVLTEAGVAAADRRTSGLDVQPSWDPARNRENGHTVTYDLQAVVRDLDAAGRLVQHAAEQVGDRLRVRGFALAVRDPRPPQEEARRRAVEACQAEAAQLAAAAGAQLGELVSLRSGGGGGRQEPRFSGRVSAVAEGLPVEAGEQEVVVAVTGTWRLVRPAR